MQRRDIRWLEEAQRMEIENRGASGQCTMCGHSGQIGEDVSIRVRVQEGTVFGVASFYARCSDVAACHQREAESQRQPE